MQPNNILDNKTIVVTGATSGIGFETVRTLAGYGAHVIGIGRSPGRIKTAEENIRRSSPQARFAYLAADLSSQREIHELADSIREIARSSGSGYIDVLVNNAGTVSSWYTTTEEGYELQFAVNHLAPFLLTHKLMPLLQSAPWGRVITVSSHSHRKARINWADVMLRRLYNCLRAYKQSKVANVLFTYELNRRLGADSPVQAFAADPGLVNTAIGLKGTGGIEAWVWERRRKRGATPEQGAATVIHLASEPALDTQVSAYWKDCQPVQPSRYSRRQDEAARLWEFSERLCGFNSEDTTGF